MMYHLKWIAKHDGIYTVMLELSRMLWYSKPIRTDRALVNYRLKNARGVWNIRRPENYNGLGKYEIWKTGTIYPRCADSFHKVFCDLYNLGREV